MATGSAEIGEVTYALALPDASVLVGLRGWVRQVMVGVTPEMMIDLELVCTELVSNALEHARGPRYLRLVHHRDTHQVRIEVDDASPDALPTVGVSRLGPQRGRGLQLVDAVARWGVHRDRYGKTLWAQLPIS